MLNASFAKQTHPIVQNGIFWRTCSSCLTIPGNSVFKHGGNSGATRRQLRFGGPQEHTPVHLFNWNGSANMAHIRQSRPDSGLGFQVKALTRFWVGPHQVLHGGNFRPVIHRKFQLASKPAHILHYYWQIELTFTCKIQSCSSFCYQIVFKLNALSFENQVLHGGNFGPVIHRKFQLYGGVMFIIFLAMPTVQVNA